MAARSNLVTLVRSRSDRGARGTATLTMRPLLAVCLGTVFLVSAASATVLVSNETARTVTPLLFVVPVIGAALVGGSRASVVIALEAALLFTAFLPPLGSVRVHAGEDLVALTVFASVAIVTGRLVAGVVRSQVARASFLEAQELDRRGLLRAVSHDLRTPLTAIRAAATDLTSQRPVDAARSGPPNLDPDQEELLELIIDETERLDRLVANLLNMSRIEAGALNLDVHPLDVGHVVESALVRLRRLTRGIVIDADIALGLPLIDGDGVQLEQVVTNLIENAVRFTPAGGVIAVRVDCDAGGLLRVNVADRGPGLPHADIERLFAPFTSFSEGGSSGVGLAICRAVVERHRGTITARTRPGGGAEFEFVLPPRAAGPESSVAVPRAEARPGG